jgi:hypothetical protein
MAALRANHGRHMQRSGRRGFAALETIASLALLAALMVLIQQVQVLGMLYDERSHEVVERERALAGALPGWMAGEDSVLILFWREGLWEPVFVPHRGWLPETRAGDMSREGAHVFAREWVREGAMEGWMIHYRASDEWRPWGRFLLPAKETR